MEASVNVSKIVVPFVPSLLHFSLVRVAFPLFESFDNDIWGRILEEMKHVSLRVFNETRSNNHVLNKAKEQLLLFPAHLRLGILETIMGLHSTVVQWRMNRPPLQIPDNFQERLFFKTDGTIDRIKTVQQLVLNEDINIEQRFDLACSYFFRTSICLLWAEMQQSGKAAKSLMAYNPISRFWIKRIRNKHRIPLMYAIRLYLNLPEQFVGIPVPRFSTFFPSLQPKNREKFLNPLMKTTSDDFLCCLYAATKEEELQILKMGAKKLLLIYLDWPLQSSFLEMAEKLWDFIDLSIFKEVLEIIYSCSEKRMDFDYDTLFMDFWEKSPNNLKEEAMASASFCFKIKFVFNSIKIRKGGANNKTNSKRKRYELPPEIEQAVDASASYFLAYFMSVFFGEDIGDVIQENAI